MRLRRELRYAQMKLKDREHKGGPHDDPQVLRTLGFWPDCECCECYAIHCLDDALRENFRLRESLAATEAKS